MKTKKAMNSILEIKEAVIREIVAHNDENYVNTQECEDNEIKILEAYKKHFGYDFEEDTDAMDYFLKAIITEIWQYHLNIIIPRLEKTIIEFDEEDFSKSLSEIKKNKEFLNYENDSDLASISYVNDYYLFILNGSGIFGFKTKMVFLQMAKNEIKKRNLKKIKDE